MAHNRHRSVISTGTVDSIGSYNGSLYPERDFNASVRTENTLWRQYSLIEKESKTRTKSDGICCTNDKLRPWLLRVSFLTVTFLGLFLSILALRFNAYSEKKITITGGDQVLLPTSTYFNKKMLIAAEDKNQSSKLHLYLMKNVPPVSNTTVAIRSGGSFYLASWTYEFWGFYLLEGTELKISLCADLHLQFYVIKGDKKLKLWTQQTLFTEYDFHLSVHPKSNCDVKSNFVVHKFTVSHSDRYYLFYTTSVGWRFLTHVTVGLDFNRTYYDLSNALYSCRLDNESCMAAFDYGTENIALVYASGDNPGNELSPFQRVGVKATPIARWDFYLKLYGSIYGIIVLLTILYTIYRAISNACSSNTSVERKPLLPNKMAYQRAYSYSLRSAAGSHRRAKKNAWVVISPVDVDQQADNYIFETRDRDNESIVTNEEAARRETLLSDLSVSSQRSNFMRSRSETHFDNFRRQQQLLDDQQLLDSVMTSAGVSAI